VVNNAESEAIFTIDSTANTTYSFSNILDDGSGNMTAAGNMTCGSVIPLYPNEFVVGAPGNNFSTIYAQNFNIDGSISFLGPGTINAVGLVNLGNGANVFNQVACVQVATDNLYVNSATSINVGAQLDFASPILYNSTNSSAGSGYVAMEPLNTYEYVSNHPSGIPAGTDILVPIPTGKAYTNIRRLECIAVVSSGTYQGVWTQNDSIDIINGVYFSTWSSSTTVVIRTQPTWAVTTSPVIFYLWITTI
jgi:hypothetical protein